MHNPGLRLLRALVVPKLGSARDLGQTDQTIANQRTTIAERYALVARIAALVIGTALLMGFRPRHFVVLEAVLLAVAVAGLMLSYLDKSINTDYSIGNLGWIVTVAAVLTVLVVTRSDPVPYILLPILPIIGAAARFNRTTGLAAVSAIVAGAAVVELSAPGIPTYAALVLLASLAAGALAVFTMGMLELESRARAAVDPLTELYNRHHLAGHTAGIDISLTRGEQAAVVAIDLDHFKNVNDIHGHERGDQLLREFSDLLRVNIRDRDKAFRAGGEEFIVILPGADPFTARRVAERIQTAMRSRADQMLGVTASIGVAATDVSQDSDMAATLRAADAALYRAKGSGRDCVRCALATVEVGGS